MRLSVGFTDGPTSPVGDKVALRPEAVAGSPPAAPKRMDASKKRASLEYLAMEVSVPYTSRCFTTGRCNRSCGVLAAFEA